MTVEAEEEMGESSPLIESKVDPQQKYESEKTIASIGYALAIGVCGLSSNSYGSSIEDLATNVGSTSVDLGSVFIVRGVGNILGSLLFPTASQYLTPTYTIVIFLAILVIFTYLVPFVVSIPWLYVFFFINGFAGSLVDAAGMGTTRMLHGAKSGPWMTTNILCYVCSGAISLLIQAVSPTTTLNFIFVGFIGTIVFLYVFFQPNLDAHFHCTPAEVTKKDHRIKHYYVEVLAGLALMTSNGAISSLTAYLETYVDDTGVIDSDYESYLVMVFWVGLIAGNMYIAFGQVSSTIETMYTIFVACSVTGVTICAFLLLFPSSAVLLWSLIAVLGIVVGPGVCLIFDINNRLTISSDLSTSILMVGMNLGGGFVPYVVTLLWDYSTLDTASLFVTVGGLMFLSLLFVFTWSVSYVKHPHE